MKKHCILLTLFACLWVSHVQAQQVVFKHKMTFTDLFVGGQAFKFVQRCTTSMDSLLKGGLVFGSASVGSVEDCSLKIITTGYYITRTSIETKDSKNTQELLNMAILKHGESFEKRHEKKNIVYAWTSQASDDKLVESSVTLSKKGNCGRYVSIYE